MRWTRGRHRPKAYPLPLVETWETCRTWYTRPTWWQAYRRRRA